MVPSYFIGSWAGTPGLGRLGWQNSAENIIQRKRDKAETEDEAEAEAEVEAGTGGSSADVMTVFLPDLPSSQSRISTSLS